MKSYTKIKRYGIILFLGLMTGTHMCKIACVESSSDDFTDEYHQGIEKPVAQQKSPKKYRNAKKIVRATASEVMKKMYRAVTVLNPISFFFSQFIAFFLFEFLRWVTDQIKKLNTSSILNLLKTLFGNSNINSFLSEFTRNKKEKLKNFLAENCLFFVIFFVKVVTEDIMIGGIRDCCQPISPMLYRVFAVTLLTLLSFIGIYAPWWVSLPVYAGICVVISVLTRKKNQRIAVAALSGAILSLLPWVLIRLVWWALLLSGNKSGNKSGKKSLLESLLESLETLVERLLTMSHIDIQKNKREVAILDLLTSYGTGLMLVRFWEMFKKIIHIGSGGQYISLETIFEKSQNELGNIVNNSNEVKPLRNKINFVLSYVNGKFGDRGEQAVTKTMRNVLLVVAKNLFF